MNRFDSKGKRIRAELDAQIDVYLKELGII